MSLVPVKLDWADKQGDSAVPEKRLNFFLSLAGGVPITAFCIEMVSIIFTISTRGSS
jgi:hypothetical protein